MKKKSVKLDITSLDTSAILFATLLSLACFFRGAVTDMAITLSLIFFMPLMIVAMYSARSVHTNLKNMGIIFFVSAFLILCLQQFISQNDIWQQAQAITEVQSRATIIYDKVAWFQSLGRFLLCGMAFVTALAIGSSESSARMFLQTLLVTGIFLVALTFLLSTQGGVTTSPNYAFSHGFVNPNNAAAYFGIMLLLAITQAARFFRRPAVPLSRILTDVLDRLTLFDILKAFFFLFAILLMMTALFMTGSRGGVLVTLVSSFVLCVMLAFKMRIKFIPRGWIVILTIFLLVGLVIFTIDNFGVIFLDVLEREGTSSHTRLDIFASILPMIRDHAWLGVGLGNFPAVFMAYRPKTISAEGFIDKAHNSYLEFAAEMGVPLFIVLMAVLCIVAYLLYRGIVNRTERYLMPMLGLSMWLLCALHSLIDFPLQIPAIAAMVIAIMTICTSQTDPRFSQSTQISQNAPIKRIRIRKRKKPNPS